MKIRVQEFIDEVINGTRPHCRWVKLAVQRYLDDLEHGAERGLSFDEEAATHSIEFFKYVKHSKGEWAGKVFELEPWEQFILWNLFGWKNADGIRRYRIAYLEIARKNGKTQFAAGVGNYLFQADGEPGSEVYSVATKLEQAKISFQEAVRMVKQSPLLKKRVTCVVNNMSIVNTASKFEPLGADANTLDGLNPHGVIIDELHAHKTAAVWDVMDTAKGARRQPLLFAITTAGFNRESICWKQHEYVEKILEGVLTDDTYFGMIFTIDAEDIKGDKYFDEETWKKANPNLGVCVKVDDMKAMAAKAKEMPSALNSFLRLKLNVWTESESRWFTKEKWDACAGSVIEDELVGKVCYPALDLSSSNDITALVYVFPIELEKEIETEIDILNEEGEIETIRMSSKYKYKVLSRFFLPEATIMERVKKARIPYDVWVREGYITKTPGTVIDYDYILAQFDRDMQKFSIREVAYDRWGAVKIIPEMSARGVDVVQFGQGFKDMSPASKDFERLLLSRNLEHGNNPVLNWMASNVVVEQDASGNIKPSKEKSSEKIDGIVAMIMGIDRCLRKGDTKSVYEERGLLTFG
jgi:phage terminase large subunit-like protein